ncbi:lectin subunit alpha-like [Musca vetustissima]|uniref:lectin subunit alpha-like n=1 Tax=Musca vetustissima TaxID=27455 RepID=UPI002AB6ED19|nr:lectin subunit alpha-like [Musca vetustissima]
MWESKPNYRWNDHKCDWPRLGYICEDHHLLTECTGCSEEKIQQITRAAGAVLEEYQAQQEAQIESLQKTLEKLEHEELRFKENLNSLLTKIEMETSKLLVTYRVQMNSVLDERSETLHSVNLGLRSDIEMLTKKFSKKLENVKIDYRNILKA